jgi:ring-1,2-phenylacetyl-CoA epoxidase subunit PaaD
VSGAKRARAIAAAVPDPEIPALTIDDLGILRDVRLGGTGTVEVVITPTYSGCPAMDAIRDDVTAALHAGGFAEVRVELVLSPAWTTDWMSAEGRRKLREYGVAPPHPRPEPVSKPRSPADPIPVSLAVRCPQCGSPDTVHQSRFGSTACKSLWRCRACREPFEQFKTL